MYRILAVFVVVAAVQAHHEPGHLDFYAPVGGGEGSGIEEVVAPKTLCEDAGGECVPKSTVCRNRKRFNAFLTKSCPKGQGCCARKEVACQLVGGQCSFTSKCKAPEFAVDNNTPCPGKRVCCKETPSECAAEGGVCRVTKECKRAGGMVDRKMAGCNGTIADSCCLPNMCEAEGGECKPRKECPKSKYEIEVGPEMRQACPKKACCIRIPDVCEEEGGVCMNKTDCQPATRFAVVPDGKPACRGRGVVCCSRVPRNVCEEEGFECTSIADCQADADKKIHPGEWSTSCKGKNICCIPASTQI